MKLRVVTEIGFLASEMQKHFRETGLDVTTESRSVQVPELIMRPGLSADDIISILSQINPFRPKITVSESLGDVDVELCLGEARELSEWKLHMYVEGEDFSKKVSGPLHAMGFSDSGHSNTRVEENEMKYGGASDFARGVIAWFARSLGITDIKQTKTWSDSDHDIYLRVIDPVTENPKGLAEITLKGDDLTALIALQGTLSGLGFAKVSVVHDPEAGEQFSLRAGPFTHDEAALAELTTTVSSYLDEQGVVSESHPLKTNTDVGSVVVTLPIQSYRDGGMERYAGDDPSRWNITIRTDAEEEVAPLVETLEGLGYEVDVEDELPSGTYAFHLRTGEISEFEETYGAIRDAVTALIEGSGLDEENQELEEGDTDNEPDNVYIDLPLELLRSGNKEELKLRAMASNYNFRLKTPDSEGYDGLYSDMEGWGFSSIGREDETPSAPNIKYGGAPIELINHLVEIIHQKTGLRPDTNKEWGDDDKDVWIYLPREGTVAAEPVDEEAIDTSVWFTRDGIVDTGDLIEVTADTVRIGHVVLPRIDGEETRLVPPQAMFRHYCLDQRTAETLIHVAEGVQLREPVLLEGETSVSKTSVIQMLASLVGQPLVRLNLNGQTDTGELVGRFLPQNLIGDLPVEADELLEARDLLEAESRMILETAEREGRKLSAVEVQQIMANEGMRSHPWRWADGLVVSAMKHGWWLVLDELNLAEPQILERMNSVLERTPTLVLTEHDNTVIGASGLPVHPNFRVFATMNPAEYAGRSVLSPAYRDRWRGYRFVPAPEESDYHTMLQFLVSGQQPDVVLRGRRYYGREQAPAYGALAGIPDIDGFLEALARFHSALESTARNPEKQRAAGLGVRRRERYIFTRRGLLAVMDLLTNAVATGMDPTEAMRVAILRYYLGRIANTSDQRTVAKLMDAAGLGFNTWSIGGGEE